MPVTKTAMRALRSSKRKRVVNKKLQTRLEIALRLVKKNPTKENVKTAITIVDLIAKKNLIHKNKAARIKSRLAKKLNKSSKPQKKTSDKK